MLRLFAFALCVSLPAMYTAVPEGSGALLYQEVPAVGSIGQNKHVIHLTSDTDECKTGTLGSLLYSILDWRRRLLSQHHWTLPYESIGDYMTRLERANREMVDTLLQSIPDTPEEGEEMHSLPQVLPNTHSSSMTEINGRPELKNLLDKNSLLMLQKRKLRSVSSENNIVIHFNSLRKKAALSMIEGASANDWTIIKNELCKTFSIVCKQVKSIVNALSDKNLIRNVGDKNSRFSEKKSSLLAPISENINPRSSSMAPNHKLGGRYKQDDATILFKRNILADSHKYQSKLDLKFLIDASHFANDSNSQFLPTVNQRNAREINLRLLNSSFVWRSAPYAERNIIIDIDLPSTEENYLITSVRNTDSIPRTNSRSFPSIDNIDNYMNTNNNTIINGRNNTLIRPLATLPSIATVPHTRRTGDDKNRTSNQISCSVQARLDRASHLQRAIELLLISLPASLQEMLDAAAQPTVEDFIFRPQGRSIFSIVGGCARCYMLDPRGRCREVLFCKGGRTIRRRILGRRG